MINLEAEKSLLGSIIFHNDLVMILGIEEADFGHSSHQRLFNHIDTCLKSNAPANQLSLKGFFETLPEGIDYLPEILSSIESVLTPSEILKTLRELRFKRELESISNEITQDLAGTLKNSQEIKDAILERLDAMTIKQSGKQITLGDAARKAFAAKKTETISSGYESLDSIINGFDLGDLIVLAGRPGMGKSCFAANISLRVARRKEPVLFISLEMKAEQISKRVIANLSSVHLTKLKNNNLTSQHEVEAFQRAIQEADQLPIYFEDAGGLTLPKLKYQIKKFVNKTKGKLVVLDYIQLIKHKTKGQRVDDVTEITNTLKDLAMEFNIVILGLSQLSRAVEQREDKRPMLSDLRESGSIEQDASVVMFTFRPEYYLKGEEGKYRDAGKSREWEMEMQRLKGIAYILVAKVRDGECGETKLLFQGEFQRFSEQPNNF